MVQRFGPLMNKGGAAISLTYIASERIIPGKQQHDLADTSQHRDVWQNSIDLSNLLRDTTYVHALLRALRSHSHIAIYDSVFGGE